MEQLDKMIFISGRFRSGTTILWHIFRSVPEVCAYIEPLHDNLLAYIAAETPTDPTHKGVSDYWAEYRNIFEDLGKLHKREFGVSRLCLGQNEEYPELRDYLQFLVNSAESKIPVFKFVRVDYRLPWLKQTFPKAKIISIRRNPRDNWLSIISKSPSSKWYDPWVNTGYDLLVWSANLAQHFNFISTATGHSYARSYCLWKISAAVADKYSDIVIDYDRDLLISPKETIISLFKLCDIQCNDLDSLVSSVVQESSRKWEEWPVEIPFDEIEEKCDIELNLSGILTYIKYGGLENGAWPEAMNNQYPTELLKHLCLEISELRDLYPSFATLSSKLESELKSRDVEQAILIERIGSLDNEIISYKTHWFFRMRKQLQSLKNKMLALK
jgi:hypothetical protein